MGKYKQEFFKVMKKYELELIEVMDMWLWQRMKRTSWIEKKRNVIILEEVKDTYITH